MARLVFVPPPLLPSARTCAAQSARARASVVGGMVGGASWSRSWCGEEGRGCEVRVSPRWKEGGRTCGGPHRSQAECVRPSSLAPPSSAAARDRRLFALFLPLALARTPAHGPPPAAALFSTSYTTTSHSIVLVCLGQCCLIDLATRMGGPSISV